MSGKVSLVVIGNRGKEIISVLAVLFVPDLRNNLLSISKITDQGRQVIFSKNECKVMKDKKIVVSARRLPSNLMHYQKILFTTFAFILFLLEYQRSCFEMTDERFASETEYVTVA